jgi:phage-related protein
MSDWKIIITKPVRKFILEQTREAQAIILRDIDLLAVHGLELGMPYVKFIEYKIYELRIKDRANNYRIFYFAHIEKTFVLVHAIVKKTQKTPRQDIELSIKRMKEIRGKGND